MQQRPSFESGFGNFSDNGFVSVQKLIFVFSNFYKFILEQFTTVTVDQKEKDVDLSVFSFWLRQ